jgi:hypothetical protein
VFWQFFSDSESKREDNLAVSLAVIFPVIVRVESIRESGKTAAGRGVTRGPWRPLLEMGAIEVVYRLCWRRVPVIGVCAKQTISGRRIPPRGVLAKSDKVVLVLSETVLVLSETVLVLVIEFRKVEIMVLSE